MTTARIKGKIKLPDLDFTKELKSIAQRIFIPQMVAGIQKGVDINQQSYPPLAPQTIKLKGHASPLIDTGKLHRSFNFKGRGKNRVLISLRSERKEVGNILQNKGVKSKRFGKRRFEFFGVSDKMERLAMSFMRKVIKGAIKRAG